MVEDSMGTAKRGAGTSAEKPKRKLRSKAEINRLLLGAAREEFKRYGFAGATTAAIARNARVTETQLFRHFPSKADLFRAAVFEPLNGHLLEFLQREPGDTLSDRRGQAQHYIGELQKFLGEHSKLMLSLVMTQMFADGAVDGIDRIDTLEAYFQQGASLFRQRLDATSDVDPDLMVRVSFAALMGCVLFKDVVCPPGRTADVAVQKAILDFMLDGIMLNAADCGRII